MDEEGKENEKPQEPAISSPGTVDPDVLGKAPTPEAANETATLTELDHGATMDIETTQVDGQKACVDGGLPAEHQELGALKAFETASQGCQDQGPTADEESLNHIANLVPGSESHLDGKEIAQNQPTDQDGQSFMQQHTPLQKSTSIFRKRILRKSTEPDDEILKIEDDHTSDDVSPASIPISNVFTQQSIENVEEPVPGSPPETNTESFDNAQAPHHPDQSTQNYIADGHSSFPQVIEADPTLTQSMCLISSKNATEGNAVHENHTKPEDIPQTNTEDQIMTGIEANSAAGSDSIPERTPPTPMTYTKIPEKRLRWSYPVRVCHLTSNLDRYVLDHISSLVPTFPQTSTIETDYVDGIKIDSFVEHPVKEFKRCSFYRYFQGQAFWWEDPLLSLPNVNRRAKAKKSVKSPPLQREEQPKDTANIASGAEEVDISIPIIQTPEPKADNITKPKANTVATLVEANAETPTNLSIQEAVGSSTNYPDSGHSTLKAPKGILEDRSLDVQPSSRLASIEVLGSITRNRGIDQQTSKMPSISAEAPYDDPHSKAERITAMTARSAHADSVPQHPAIEENAPTPANVHPHQAPTLETRPSSAVVSDQKPNAAKKKKKPRLQLLSQKSLEKLQAQEHEKQGNPVSPAEVTNDNTEDQNVVNIDYDAVRSKLLSDYVDLVKKNPAPNVASYFREDCINIVGRPAQLLTSWNTCTRHVGIAYFISNHRSLFSEPTKYVPSSYSFSIGCMNKNPYIIDAQDIGLPPSKRRAVLSTGYRLEEKTPLEVQIRPPELPSGATSGRKGAKYRPEYASIEKPILQVDAIENPAQDRLSKKVADALANERFDFMQANGTRNPRPKAPGPVRSAIPIKHTKGPNAPKMSIVDDHNSVHTRPRFVGSAPSYHPTAGEYTYDTHRQATYQPAISPSAVQNSAFPVPKAVNHTRDIQSQILSPRPPDHATSRGVYDTDTGYKTAVPRYPSHQIAGHVQQQQHSDIGEYYSHQLSHNIASGFTPIVSTQGHTSYRYGDLGDGVSTAHQPPAVRNLSTYPGSARQVPKQDTVVSRLPPGSGGEFDHNTSMIRVPPAPAMNVAPRHNMVVSNSHQPHHPHQVSSQTVVRTLGPTSSQPRHRVSNQPTAMQQLPPTGYGPLQVYTADHVPFS